MNREVHVRFWEGLGVRFPWATRLHCGEEGGIGVIKSTCGRCLCF